jgi:hypothetical protein
VVPRRRGLRALSARRPRVGQKWGRRQGVRWLSTGVIVSISGPEIPEEQGFRRPGLPHSIVVVLDVVGSNPIAHPECLCRSGGSRQLGGSGLHSTDVRFWEWFGSGVPDRSRFHWIQAAIQGRQRQVAVTPARTPVRCLPSPHRASAPLTPSPTGETPARLSPRSATRPLETKSQRQPLRHL